jgi:transcriptional regulator with XRE-family HTH domain
MVALQELLGARIRICIEKAGYRTVEAFAFEFGIGKSTLSDVLTGKKSPTVSTLARWANALKIPMREFFEDRQLDDWVRETPPDYFHNRGKTPRSPKKSRVPRAPRVASAPKSVPKAVKSKARPRKKSG